MSFSDYLELELLDHVFGSGDYNPPSGSHFGLSTASIDDDAGGLSEPPALSGYTRASVANDKTTWSDATAGSLTNDIAIEFPQATGGNWGTVTHFGIFDASSGGNLLAWGTLSQSKSIETNDTASFASGSITISLD